MRALLLANSYDADAGYVGERFAQLGYRFELLARDEPSAWPPADEVDLVVQLGSDWSVYWDHVSDGVEAEAALCRMMSARGVPTFAICFGAQLHAYAHGGVVERSPAAEVGWYAVSSALPGPVQEGPWFQWHYDRFTAPPGAMQLATGPMGAQAYRMGRTLATQYHPEVTPEMVARWSGSAGGLAELEKLAIDRDELMARTVVICGSSRTRAHGLVDWFCEHVAGSTSRAEVGG